MNKRKVIPFIPVLAAISLASGCAGQQELRQLRADVDALQEQIQRVDRDTANALRISNQLVKESAAARQAAETASADAAATRSMLEQINERIGSELSQSTLK